MDLQLLEKAAAVAGDEKGPVLLPAFVCSLVPLQVVKKLSRVVTQALHHLSFRYRLCVRESKAEE